MILNGPESMNSPSVEVTPHLVMRAIYPYLEASFDQLMGASEGRSVDHKLVNLDCLDTFRILPH